MRRELTAREQVWADYVALWRAYAAGREAAWRLAAMSNVWTRVRMRRGR